MVFSVFDGLLALSFGTATAIPNEDGVSMACTPLHARTSYLCDLSGSPDGDLRHALGGALVVFAGIKKAR